MHGSAIQSMMCGVLTGCNLLCCVDASLDQQRQIDSAAQRNAISCAFELTSEYDESVMRNYEPGQLRSCLAQVHLL